MTILIKQATRVAGAAVAAGTLQKFSNDIDAGLVNAGQAVYLGVPSNESPIPVPAIRNEVSKSRRFPGRPIIIFANGVSDLNVTYCTAGAGGSYAVDSVNQQFSPTPFKLVPGPSAANTWITVDLSSAQSSNLQRFLWDHDSVLGVLVYAPNPAALGALTFYATVQSNRLASRYNGSLTLTLGASDRPGWWFLTFAGDRYGFVDTSGQFQQGINPEVTGGANLILDSTTYVDSLRMQVVSASADTIGTTGLTIDSVWLVPRAKPALSLVFDDGYISQYIEGFEYLARMGLKGTLAATKTLVGTNGYMTAAQLDDLYQAGWDIVNHASTHFNANQKSLNAVATSQTPVSGNLALDGAVGSSTFDAPRCLVLTTAGNETGRPFTVTGLGEFGEAQTEVIYGRNTGTTVSERLWTKITTISIPSNAAAAVQVGTTYSYDETLAEYRTCRDWLLSMGWTRGLDCAVYPNGASNAIVDRVMRDLGIRYARTVSTTYRYAYPWMPGFRELLLPGYGGGGTGQAAAGYGVIGKYNTGNGTISTPTFPALPKYTDWLVTFTAATTFEVTETDGKFVGTGSTGTAFTSRGVSFTITAGVTPFVAGDAFRVVIGNPLLTIEQEIIARRAVGTLYWHDIIRSGSATSVQTLRSDFRMTIDQIAADVRDGKLEVLTLSELASIALR